MGFFFSFNCNEVPGGGGVPIGVSSSFTPPRAAEVIYNIAAFCSKGAVPMSAWANMYGSHSQVSSSHGIIAPWDSAVSLLGINRFGLGQIVVGVSPGSVGP